MELTDSELADSMRRIAENAAKRINEMLAAIPIEERIASQEAHVDWARRKLKAEEEYLALLQSEAR